VGEALLAQGAGDILADARSRQSSVASQPSQVGDEVQPERTTDD